MAKLESAKKERDTLLSIVDKFDDGIDWIQRALQAEAEIEAMRRQEPVAFALYSGWARKAVFLTEIEACEQRDRRQLTADLSGSLEAYRVVPLYALPGAKPAPSVPEGWPTEEMTRAFAVRFNVRDQQGTFVSAFRAALAAALKSGDE